MKIVEQRCLRGPNRYTAKACLYTVIDLEDLYRVSTRDVPGFAEQLLGVMPSLRQHSGGLEQRCGFVDRVRAGTDMACVLEQLTVELECLVGAPVRFARSHELRGTPGRFLVLCEYRCESVARPAFELAMAFTCALAHGEKFDIGTRLAGLRAAAGRCAVDSGTAAVLAAAHRRGIPSLRITDEANLFQLGWASNARRLQATATDASSHLAVGIASDWQLANALLEHAGHAATLARFHTGMATTAGVYVDNAMTIKGDGTGYRSSRALLSAPDVDFAVLETSLAGILKGGLAFDRCDVGVVLNVSADHLGMDGVGTLEELARVKAVVARAASHAVVLNAADDLCVAMACALQDPVEVLYFASDLENPVLLRHLGNGGRAVYVDNQTVVLANGRCHQALLDVRSMPVSLHGLARYNIENALAAAAALTAIGFSNAQVAAGLRSFVSDGKNNPLCSNQFDVDGVSVIADHAHNCAAYAALAELARGMTAGEIVGVVSVPGDRRDQDLIHTGMVCAAGFDKLVIYESDNRGRQRGETARLIAHGARCGHLCSGRLHCKLEVHQAIRDGLALCQRGDVLLFGCGTSLNELIEALRPALPHVAERITAETN